MVSPRHVRRKAAFLIEGDIDQLTGGYLYDKMLIDFLEAHEIRVDVVGIPRMPFPLKLLGNLWFFLRLRREDHDLVLEDEMIYGSLGLFNLWLRRARYSKIVSLVHLLEWVQRNRSAESWLTRFFEKFMLSSCHLNVVNSHHTAGVLRRMGLNGSEVLVVYPSFNLPETVKQEQEPEDFGALKLLFVGNSIRRKGLEYLIDAMDRLSDLNVQLDIVGGTDREPAHAIFLKAKIDELGLRQRIFFHGKVSWKTLAEFYSKADIFVFPSLYEGFGIVIAEAMAFGLPVIATNVGAASELIRNGENGLLVQPGSADALASAVRVLISDPSLRRRFGLNGLEKAKALPKWEESCQSLLARLESLMADIVRS